MDGSELLAQIKRRFPDLPVMMVTAYGDNDRRKRAAKHGAAEFITKPVDFISSQKKRALTAVGR